MSKRINVNPGQYKVAGRERLGEPLGPQREKQALPKDRERAKPKGAAKKR